MTFKTRNSENLLKWLTPPLYTIVGKLLDGEEAGSQELFFPFFSTHLALPVKKGEVVWVYYHNFVSTDAADSSVSTNTVREAMVGGPGAIFGTTAGAPSRSASQSPHPPIFRQAIVEDVFCCNTSHLKYFSTSGAFDPNSGEKIRCNRGYWVSRVVGSALSEDLNHTCFSRDLDPELAERHENEEPDKLEAMIPGYTNGTGFADGIMIHEEGLPLLEKYQAAVHGEGYIGFPEEDISNVEVDDSCLTPEAVFPYPKKQGDLVIQGSNNTAIKLGESDQTFGSDASRMDKPPGERTYSGMIDIVTGRCQTPATSGKIVQNIAGHPEADKNRDFVHVHREDAEPQEGEIELGGADVTNDLSRIVVSSRMPVDHLFCDPGTTGASTNLTLSDAPPVTSKRSILVKALDAVKSLFGFSDYGSGDEESQKFEGEDPEDVDVPKTLINPAASPDDLSSVHGDVPENVPAIAIKSDHVRIVGRQTLRFMVESDAGAPEIILHKDGNIFIKPGPNGQVYIGGGPDDAAAGSLDPKIADVTTYPDATPMGFAGENAVYSKKPGVNSSTKVKVFK